MSWGNKLLLTFVAFAAGMGYLVYRSTNVNYELVEKDYYKTELRYQEVIDGTARTNALITAVSIEQNNTGLLLRLPDEMTNKILSGNIWFYCAYDEKKDRKFTLRPDMDAKQLFEPSTVSPGIYTVKISWTDKSNNYYAEKKLTIL